MTHLKQAITFLFALLLFNRLFGQHEPIDKRERTLLSEGWKFYRYPTGGDNLIYDVRPEVKEDLDKREAAAKPVASKGLSTGNISWTLNY
ncbi:hypothetical protein H8B06_09020 [Sphingobacterium sp. DN00404]|uniref:Uncharacterized protein n=1 Tax=Sphingobacterium micropteri TaxID=2763501 RepID=A0ABR7YNQ6_9SPHI|nr:hypothetical protein [Sphingobacterium micropteri]MBD1432965.1 hypothetical protein [Sphingobacterium micropteri]